MYPSQEIRGKAVKLKNSKKKKNKEKQRKIDQMEKISQNQWDQIMFFERRNKISKILAK